MKETLEDYWIIKVDDENYYCGWMNNEYFISKDYDDCIIFDSQNMVKQVLEEIKSIYPNARTFHVVTTMSEE